MKAILSTPRHRALRMSEPTWSNPLRLRHRKTSPLFYTPILPFLEQSGRVADPFLLDRNRAALNCGHLKLFLNSLRPHSLASR